MIRSARSASTARTALWGLIAVGLFSDGTYGAGWNGVGATKYMGQAGRGVTGLFYGDPSQLVAQCIEAGTAIAWNVIIGGSLFWLIGKAIGGNRVSAETEIGGLDVPEMGVPGYPEFVLNSEMNPPRVSEARARGGRQHDDRGALMTLRSPRPTWRAARACRVRGYRSRRSRLETRLAR